MSFAEHTRTRTFKQEDSVGERFNILIADRNPHVREFLKREMTAAGFYIQVAGDSHKILQLIYESESAADILIIDPDLPGSDGLSVLKKIKTHAPSLLVVVHTFLADFWDCGIKPDMLNVVAFVEKGGSSVETLKDVIFSVLDIPNSQDNSSRNLTQTIQTDSSK